MRPARHLLCEEKRRTTDQRTWNPKSMALATDEPRADSLNSTLKNRLRVSLHEVSGIDSLRPGQEALMANVLRRADSLAITPTGAGKSLCYQLSALYLGGLTLVVSLLISLMKGS
jgi:superfamily II DNA helicase RecQ